MSEEEITVNNGGKEYQTGCTCIICGGFIPVIDSREHITPICINCRDILRKIVLERREG